MTYTDKHIINAYADILESLSPGGKKELIESLSKSLKKERRKKEMNFYKSFGAFGSSKSALTIIKEIKTARKFSKKEIKL
ncbi:MAG: hypothetical protein K2X48_17715 [Chitinophagaceae bacterium]|nr:hypothetical protein [Chitinophagaceae bacterium]